MKQLEINEGKVICPIDRTEIPVELCEGCSKNVGNTTEKIILCRLGCDY